MKALFTSLLGTAVLLLATDVLPDATQAPAAAQSITVKTGKVRIPTKWFRGAKGYQKALDLQKEADADIFIWFSRPNTPDEKGLCKWFEDKGVKSLPVRKLLREYVRVTVVLPGNPKNQDLARKFRLNKTPAVYVVHPDGWRNRCKVFEWEDKRPKLLKPEELVELFRLNSSEKYHPPAENEE